MGLFFIVELHLVLFGESDLNPATRWGDGLVLYHRHISICMPSPLWRLLNPVTGRQSGEWGLRMVLLFIVQLHLVLFGESDVNSVTDGDTHGSLGGGYVVKL